MKNEVQGMRFNYDTTMQNLNRIIEQQQRLFEASQAENLKLKEQLAAIAKTQSELTNEMKHLRSKKSGKNNMIHNRTPKIYG